jgi:hypothetical protein
MRAGVKKHVEEERAQETSSAGAAGARGRRTVEKEGLGQQCAE